ncbi:MAG: NAD(P)H-dependent oxidoreductase [Clostridiales bacterium]|nr:NAD(P)H-dependent oxidoreductase [Clostridiales bacterium]
MTKILVAYFSASAAKITEKVAERLAETIGADLFEIVPEVPYTAADLRWTNPIARCNKEKFGRKDVPSAGKVENFEEYDLVILGFPIWYGCAPNVVSTFIKGYDTAGKKIAAFATSGGSKIGKTAEKLKSYVSESAMVLEAKLFEKDVTPNALQNWVNGLLRQN